MNPLAKPCSFLVFLLAGSMMVANAATTNAISAGQIVPGSITAPNQTNFYTFNAASNDVIYLSVLLTNGPGAFPYFYLYDPSGASVTEGAVNSIFTGADNLRVTRTGTYTVGVIDNGHNESFDYLVTVNLAKGGVNQREAGDGPEAIPLGQSSYGHIGPVDYDTFTFTAVSNDVVYVTVLATNGPGTYPYLYLYDPAGTLLIEGTGNTILAYAANLRLPVTGTYTVGIIDNQHNESFDYVITVNLAKGGVNQREAGDGPEALVPGQTGHGHISPNDYDTFTFNAASNDVIYLSVLLTNGPGAFPYFYLYDPSGASVTEGAVNSIFTGADNLRVTRTGTYTVGVIDNGHNESFDYLVTVNLAKGGVNQREAGDGPEAIPLGQSSYGHIGPVDYDTFTFTAVSNDVVYVTVLATNGPGTYPYLYLYDPAGTLLIEGTGNTILAYAANLRLPVTGTYTVGIIDNQHNESFDYVITVNLAKGGVNQREAGDGPEALVPGQTGHGHISPNDYDTFTFNAASNDVIYLSVLLTNGPGAFPYFYLYDPSGASVTEGAVNSIFTGADNLRVTRTGTYTVGVIDNGHNESFDYLVTVNLAKGGVNQREAGDGPEAIPLGQSSYGHIGPVDYDTFTFTAVSNDVVYVTVLATNGPGTYPYLYLYDPAGTLLIEGTGNTILAYAANLRLPVTGTYTVGIIDNQHNESFDYVITVNLAKGGVNQREAGDGPEALVPGQTGHGHISPNDYDTFTFNAASNDVIYLSVLLTNGPGAFPYFYLYDPSGASVTEGAVNSIFTGADNLRVTRTGTYTVGVIDNGHNESFDYLVTVNLAKGGVNQREAGDGPEAIPLGQSSYGHIGPVDYDTFTFTAVSNDVVYVTVLATNGPGTYPYLYLYDPAGTLLIEGTGNTILAYAANLRLPVTGTYTVGVIDNGHNESFDYVIAVLKVPGPNATDPGEGLYKLSPAETRSAHLSPGDLDAFEIKAIAGDTLDVALRITAGTGRNLVLHVYGPDAELIDTVSGSTRARIRLQCVNQTGAYTLVIHDDGYNEAYDYQLTLDQYPVVPPSDGLNQYLAICDCTNRVVVRWETSAQPLGFVLEANPSVDGATLPQWMASPNWTPVVAPFEVIADHFYFTESPTNATRFYRLKKAN